MERRSNSKVAVALSGGVDSAVAAALLKKQGYRVTGIFMKNYESPKEFSGLCPWREDQAMAQKVAKKLNIPFLTWNFQREYEQYVLSYMLKELRKGRTPNPDVFCNRDIKFGLFLKKARKNGFAFIATGHYAKIKQDGTLLRLYRGKDKNKDQSYFLSALSQQQLRYSIFPLALKTKHEVRMLAKRFKLPNAQRPDSQGICFVGNVPFRTFIKQYITTRPGLIIDEKRRRLGIHNGLPLYTIGQRAGLGIGGAKQPYYVAKKIQKTNTLIAVQTNTHPLLFSKKVKLHGIHWIYPINKNLFRVNAQIRYRQKPQKANIHAQKHTVLVQFAYPQRAVTPGQCVVMYRGNECLGYGIVE